MRYYLAIDIGASSGRHILAHLEDGKMVMEEIYRFPNGMQQQEGHMCWNVDGLFQEIKEGMKKCASAGKIPVSVGIDTWGVDFVLLDAKGRRLGQAVGYRDGRTQGMDGKVNAIISKEDLYKRTGIQKQIFNTIYQLMALKENDEGLLDKADSLLMIPDYFNYLLSGVKATEYTNATTTQLVDADKKDWDYELIRMLGYPKHLFQTIMTPGTTLGTLTEEAAREVGFSCNVVLPATHDTGSAVLAMPSNVPDAVYISSGTWSLLGKEIDKPNLSYESMEHNFTNEGGYGYRFRYLKNIMGLWMIQSIRKEIASDFSFEELGEAANREAIPSIVNCDDERFLSPENMTEEIRDACRISKQQVPETVGEVAAVIYNSLAVCYKDAVKELEELSGKKSECIHVIGGGGQARYLNQITADYTGKTVLAGPFEATSVGNIMVQMICSKELANREQARACVAESFPLHKYEPRSKRKGTEEASYEILRG